MPRPYENRMQPILHTGYLMFIRGKFLFQGLIASLEEKNEYTFYAIIKSYWEHVAAFGYYYLRISALLNAGQEEEAFLLAAKMGLGGRGFPTEEMIRNKGQNTEDYKLPNIYTMMDAVDKDFEKHLKQKGSMMRELYDEQIAEGGHTTYTGLTIATKWAPDRLSQLPDLKKSWESKDKASLVNLAAMSSTIFFFYWEKFEQFRK